MSDDSQQFITPPPGIAPVPKREPEPEVHAPSVEEFISLPPGVSAPDIDSGTLRVENPRRGRAEAAEAPVFFPTGAPGMPVAAPPTGPTPAVRPTASAPVSAELDEATRVAPGRRSAPAWRVALPDGEYVLLERTTLLGRAPAVTAQWPDAQLLPVSDPAKSVSKTHAAIVLDDSGAVTVHDLGSTNGTFIGYAGTEEVEVLPGQPRVVEAGAELGLGEYTVTVLRA